MSKEGYHGNGCVFPPNGYQVGSWFGGLTLACIFYVLIAPNLPEQVCVGLVVVYSIAATLCFVCLVICTVIDPSDPGLKNKRNPERFPVTMTIEEFPNICIKCKVRVRGTSKHCRACDRCTADFDHHCYWVNNCVAKPNYKWFFCLITAVEVVMTIETYSCTHIIAGVLVDEVAGSTLLEKYDMGDHGYFYFSIVVIIALICLFFTISNGFLLMFHVYLRLKCISTFEFLMAKRRANSKVYPMKYNSTAGITSQLTLNETIHPQNQATAGDNSAKNRSRKLIVPMSDANATNEDISKAGMDESKSENKMREDQEECAGADQRDFD